MAVAAAAVAAAAAEDPSAYERTLPKPSLSSDGVAGWPNGDEAAVDQYHLAHMSHRWLRCG